MPKISNYLDKAIEAKFVAENKEKESNHISSGKLSASMLNDPLQWQILKVLGVPQKELEEYVLRKFFRGNQIEDWAVGEMPDVIEKQKLIEYKNCIGFADALVDTKDWDFKLGIIPVEIKSVANAKFRRIISGGGADKGHILQACYYAMGLSCGYFAVIYVASDDLRIQCYIYETNEYRKEIDDIIQRFSITLKNGIIPKFEPKEGWQVGPKYSKFPAWETLSEEECQIKYKQLNK